LHVANAADKARIVHVVTGSSDTNNVTGCGDGAAGEIAQGDVVTAASVTREGDVTDRCVETADIIAEERLKTTGRVVETIGIVKECFPAAGCVVPALDVLKKRKSAVSGVGDADVS
jgi:hypothetical protein